VWGVHGGVGGPWAGTPGVWAGGHMVLKVGRFASSQPVQPPGAWPVKLWLSSLTTQVAASSRHKSRKVVNPLGSSPRGHILPAQAGGRWDPARPGWVRTPHTWGHQGGVGGAWAGTSDPWAGTLCDPG
jgi:hypothetical protein